MKRFPLVFILVVLIGLPLGSALGKKPTSGGEQVITARQTDTAPVIDGQMGPGEWSAAVPVHVKFNQWAVEPGVVLLDENGDFFPDFPPPENQDDLSYKVRAIYDNENLYIRVDVADDVIYDDGPCDICPWNDDDVELFFNGDLVANDFVPPFPGIGKEASQILVDPGGDMWTTPGGATNINTWGVDWEAAVGMTSRGWMAEFRLALASIDIIDGPGEQAAGPGDYIGFNVVVGDDDNGGNPYNAGPPPDFLLDDPAVDGFLKWTGTGGTFDESDWGLLFFEPAASAKPVASSAEDATWGQVKQQAK